ncbi:MULTISPECIES: histidine-type phosphatase [unclassified Streptomyces]|uniref:histidine-type phosphatase n=1 Tax=unclassified Streptomyces TaxID=2593676 RepID=UPI0001C1B145|nr:MULTISPECIES: histidine-type phosphatase [unclassified Streptomyces]AEN13557.1 histidine acid phosphatase [Streptomyces sp. SirexAA-E]MYR65149.1 histidine-type phosphatase [Streptomyces sp. SID4939]MYR99761.1 histidine-type phosphatase [Streptomyces sp. SID4940]MYT66995.1 histidine-type phosphatase [Streptomyces sp. SID8357]MYT84639.1 histidine-type phosphatase [Streptomyces sp. SID8360]
MRKRTAATALTLAASVALAAALPARAHTGDSGFYGTKTPYAPGQNARAYEQAPKGFVPVFTENVSRHGSRAASDREDGDLILALWEKARSEGQLTRTGERFGGDAEALLAAMDKIGYGQLSGRGEREIKETATRLEKRLPELFPRIVRNSEQINVVNSGKDRAVDSGTLFAEALAEGDPSLKPLITPARTDADLLYFHKSAGGEEYRDYVDNDERLATTLDTIMDQPATHTAARNVLRKIFEPAFVERMSAGELDGIGTEVDAAQAVHALYAIAPAMADEGTWNMKRYIAPRDAEWFAYLGDAEDFYEKGPGFTGSDITYRMADVLLDDFFEKIEAKRAGTSTVGAELRFTHAEEIIPLAALMELPGSTKQVSPSRPYTYGGNPWRGASVASMATNIQWDLFRKGNSYLVRMLYNEKQTAFKQGCKPVAKGSYFYDADELERCFGRAGS